MNKFLNTDKSEKLKEVLLSISKSQIYFEPQGMLSKTFVTLEDIYWMGKDCPQYRHMYSELFVIITQIDKSTEWDNEILSQNLMIVCKNYKAKNKDKNGDIIDISKSLLKLYDHVNLDIARLNYSKASNFKQHEEVANVASKLKETEISIHSKLGESITSVQKGYMNQIENTKKQFKNTISAEIKRVSEESNKMRAEYISILGIFASIVLAFTGAITFTTSVLSNIHKASIYRTVIITALIGMVVIFVLWLLMDFIKSIHGQTSRKYLYIIVPEVVLLIIILGTVGLFRLDYFREEKETSLFEANIEQNSEIEETDAVLEENEEIDAAPETE